MHKFSMWQKILFNSIIYLLPKSSSFFTQTEKIYGLKHIINDLDVNKWNGCYGIGCFQSLAKFRRQDAKSYRLSDKLLHPELLPRCIEPSR